jgi:hypothetical protein|tara:strand:+ start:75 stop:257 length:183 start_codon:yes stop_codon:yes gene_type:complete
MTLYYYSHTTSQKIINLEEHEEDLESLGEDRPLSPYGKSLQEQSDREVQQEHWQHERWSE